MEWKFPADLAAIEATECTHVYSLVLDSGHAVEVRVWVWVCGWERARERERERERDAWITYMC
jgi:hypothetical protein